MLGWIFFRALKRMPKSGGNHLRSPDDVQRSDDVCVLKCVVTRAGVGTPRSIMLWRNPKRIAWRASSSARHANTYTWWEALVTHSDQLNANFMQILPWESKVCCQNSYITVPISANMAAICPFWLNDAAVTVTVLIIRILFSYIFFFCNHACLFNCSSLMRTTHSTDPITSTSLPQRAT